MFVKAVREIAEIKDPFSKYYINCSGNVENSEGERRSAHYIALERKLIVRFIQMSGTTTR